MASAYRYGNDIRVYWTIIDSEGHDYNLENRDLRLWMKNGERKFEITNFHVAGNIITWVYYGKDQSSCLLGTFEAILCENCGEIGMATLDTQAVFRLVSRSSQSSAGDGVRVRTEAVVNIQTQLTSSVEQLCITKEEYEAIFGEGSATHGGSAMETPDVLASLKDYIDRENIEDIYVLDTYPSVGTVYSEDVFDAMVTSKAVVISGEDAILGRAIHLEGGSYLSFLKIESDDKDGVVVVATLSHGEDEYTVTALTETVVVDRVYLEQNFLSLADASATYLSKAVAAATYLKITDAAVQYVAKTGGVFTGPVSFSGGISATGASLSGEVNMNNNRIRNVASPVNDADAANKGWVVALIGSIQQFHYEVYPSLSDVTNPSGSVLYLIGPTGSGTDKYMEYVYDSSKRNPWIKIGDASIDLSGYMPKSGGRFSGRVIFEDGASFEGSLSLDEVQIHGLENPTSGTDAANKQYVDSGLATKASASDVSDINAKIPAQASANNQLADKNFVNSSIQTATATFKGNWETWADVPTDYTDYPDETKPDNNDYMVVRDASGYAPAWNAIKTYASGDLVCYDDVLYKSLDSHQHGHQPDESPSYWEMVDSNPNYEGTWFFKYNGDWDTDFKEGWLPEYQVNEKPLTAAQLAALNSGITDTKVAKLDALPATIPTEVYWCTYGTTTVTQVAAALAANKVVKVKYNDREYNFTGENTTHYFFGCLHDINLTSRITLKKADDSWGNAGPYNLQNSDSRTSDIETNKTSTTKYTSAKGVYDFVTDRTYWKKTIPGNKEWIFIYLNDDSPECILSIDSAGTDGALHGLVCIDDGANISSAVFVGSGGVDTTTDVQTGTKSSKDTIVIHNTEYQPVTITCIGGNAPSNAEQGGDTSGFTQSDTKAWTDLEAGGGGGGTTEVFWATYGTTTYSEISAAITAGKVVACMYDTRTYIISRSTDSNHIFVNLNGVYERTLTLTSANVWSNALEATLQTAGNKADTITASNYSSAYAYPSLAALNASLYKWGVISQTQTWTQDADGGYHYDMSNLQYGAIPQANIDLFTAAGAEFDTATGYFELNGLTDISYEEMKEIYDVSGTCGSVLITREGQFSFGKTRTVLPICMGAQGAFNVKITTLLYENNSIESVKFYAHNLYDLSYIGAAVNMTNPANRLKKLLGTLYMGYISAASSLIYMFKDCPSLEDVQLYGLKVSIEFSQSPRLSMSSIEYMITRADTATITITLHPTAYAAAQSDAGVQAALSSKTNVSLASA